MAQMVEHILGKDEVTGSIPVSSSKNKRDYIVPFVFGIILAKSPRFAFAVATKRKCFRLAKIFNLGISKKIKPPYLVVFL